MIEGAVHFVSALSALLAALGCAYLSIAALAAARRGEGGPSPQRFEPVTILKPLRGNEPGLSGRLRSFLDQDYAGEAQMICCAADDADPALAVARDLGRGVEICADARLHGVNRKVSNLVNAYARARHGVLTLADSDIEVGPDYLARVVGALQAPGVGAVSCLYHGVAGGSFWSELAALRINAHFLPDVLTALRFRLKQPCFGSTIALRRETLERIGGLRAFADRLADDYAIGEAVRAQGLKVAVPRFTVAHVCFANGLGDLIAQELRAARTVRSVAPLGHIGAAITHPFPLALIGLVWTGPVGLCLVAAALASRLLLLWLVERAFALPPQRYWLLPLREALSFGVFAASFFGAGVRWRGVPYRIRRGDNLAAQIK